MSHIAFPIGINLENLHATIFGSKNDFIFNSVIKSELYKKLDEEYSFKSEIKDLMHNYIQPAQRKATSSKLFGLIKADNGCGLNGEWPDYGYALHCICNYMGYIFNSENHEYVYSENLWEINTELRNFKSNYDLNSLFETKQCFDTPYNNFDIFTNCFYKKEVKELYADLITIEPYINKTNTLFTSLKNGLNYCCVNDLDVAIFSFEVIE